MGESSHFQVWLGKKTTPTHEPEKNWTKNKSTSFWSKNTLYNIHHFLKPKKTDQKHPKPANDSKVSNSPRCCSSSSRSLAASSFRCRPCWMRSSTVAVAQSSSSSPTAELRSSASFKEERGRPRCCSSSSCWNQGQPGNHGNRVVKIWESMCNFMVNPC